MSASLTDGLEKILNALARMFAEEGKAREVALLAHSKTKIEQTNYDRWNGGTYGYTVYLEVPSQLYHQVADSR